jgi:long-chain acyl-CoA synthetase
MTASALKNEYIFSGLERMSLKYPDKPALIFLGEKITFAKLQEFVNRFATALYDLGIRDNDKCVIYIANCPQWIITYFALQKIGAVPVPISPIYTPREIEYMINDSEAEAVICQDVNFRYIKQVFAATALKKIIITNLVDLLPWWKKILGRLLDKVPTGAVERTPEVFFFKDLLRKYRPQPPQTNIDPREHLAYIMYTGGTTGLPKGVPGSHATLLEYSDGYAEITRGYLREGEETLVLVNPLFHIMGQGTITGLGFNKGNTTILMPFPEIDAILEAIQKYKGSLFLGVPALYRMVLENDRVDLYDISSLRYCWVGGDVLPSEIHRRWKQKFKMPIYQTFGTTEAVFVCASPLDCEPPQGSIGCPLPFIKFKLVDPDTLDPVEPNTTGELLTSFADGTKSYWNKPEETASSWVVIDAERWYRTKDYVRMGEDGLLYYVDRAADTIKYKGYKVSCSEIEAVLQDHPAITDACVVGVPDARVGERIKAMAVLKEDARGVSASELMGWCRDRLAPYKIPKYIEFRDMLPKSKVGKLLRREIRDEERRRTQKTKEKVN